MCTFRWSRASCLALSRTSSCDRVVDNNLLRLTTHRAAATVGDDAHAAAAAGVTAP